jgi:hypothetical protein
MGESGWELSGRSTVEAHLVKPSRIRARTAEMPRPEIERVMLEMREKLLRVYGRPHVSQAVQIAAQSYSRERKVSLEKALKALIARSGSYEGLV